MDPQILVELTKIISEQNENPVRIEKNLVQKNSAKDKTGSYTVQLGSTYLTIHILKKFSMVGSTTTKILRSIGSNGTKEKTI